MIDPKEELKRPGQETLTRLIKETPLEEYLKGLSPDELLAALSPEVRAALAQRLKNEGSLPKPGGSDPGPGQRKE
jgi:hypothetical protein